MSLNLISSLSFLKSKLEKTAAAEPKVRSLPLARVISSSTKMDVRRLNSTDMFAGLTESDLDTSSSDSDDDDSSSGSSRASSPSGFNTPEINNKEEPTQDILKRCLEMLNSDISDTETQPQPDVERESLSSASSQCSVDIKTEPGGSLSPVCEGLLKIASPVKYSNSSPAWPAGEDQVTADPPPPPPPLSPGPPVLEPMTTKPSSSATTNTTNLPVKQSLVSLAPPPPPAALSLQPPMPPVATAAPGGGGVQQIILPPVQAGQQHQFLLQPSQLGGTGLVQIVQAGLPLQINNSPIPLLNAQGQLMATVGGVTSQNQLLSNLQNFVMMVQPGLTTSNNNNPIIIKQEHAANQFIKPQLPQLPQLPINTTTMPNIFQTPQPLKLGPSSVSLAGLSNTPTISTAANYNLLPAGQSFNIVQPGQAPPPSLLPANILQPQSNAMNILANGLATSQVTTSPTINLLQSTPTQPPSNMITLPPATPTSSTTASSPTVQLVQDPNTGLYNLVQQQPPAQQQPQQLVMTNPPAATISTPTSALSKVLTHSLPAVAESPKRSATPLLAKGSPAKVPKLLLPSLSGTKENKPSPDPPPKQFMCGVCNKYFGNQKNLRVHISEIHEGKRGQFPCDVCNKVFPRKRNMERHKNALHLKNSPVCYMCHKAVVNLEMHIKRFHKGSTEIKIKLEESAATA